MPKRGYKWTEKHRRNSIKARKGRFKGKLKGRKLPREVIEKQRQGRLRWYETHRAWNFGKPHTAETKRKIRETCKRNGVDKWNKRRVSRHDAA